MCRRADAGQVRRLERAGEGVADVRLYSFPYDAPAGADWHDTSRELILSADVVLCLAGPTTHDSPHIAWELDEARGSGVPVLVAGSGACDLAAGRSGVAVIDAATPELVLRRLRELV